MPPQPTDAALAALASVSKPPASESKPPAAAGAGDIGPCPGPQFVEIEWTEVGAGGVVGAHEWCEARRAAGLESNGLAKVVKKD